MKCVRDPFVFAPLRDQNQEKEKKKIKETGEQPTVSEMTPITSFPIKTSKQALKLED